MEQAGRRFVVKSFADTDDGPEDARRRLRREIEGAAAFRRAGAAVLDPVMGPAEDLTLDVGGERVTLRHALVFPYVESPTLYDAIAATRDALPLVREAGSRIRARHLAADSAAAIHSDGSAHNVFADWTWFDFCEEHSSGDLRDAKAHEVLRFIASVVEVSPVRATRPRVAAFCEAYGDGDVLTLALDSARMAEQHVRVRAWSRMLARPDKLLRLLRGDTTQFRRVRTWDALDHAIRG